MTFQYGTMKDIYISGFFVLFCGVIVFVSVGFFPFFSLFFVLFVCFLLL